MREPHPIEKEELFSRLPPVWQDSSLRLQIARHNTSTRRCVVALDDDPTGTQTVHDIWVLTQWGVDDLRSALADDEPAIYILTNSRSMPLEDAQRINREIAGNLVEAARAENRPVIVVSRSDSTLRGHYPGEVDALNEALAESQGVPFNGICLIPFFLEGGRFTVNDFHWVQEGTRLIPAAQTPYAKDAVFGYHHSYLPSWVEEKTSGRVNASDVYPVSIDTLRFGGPSEAARQLREVHDAGIVVVNAADDRDLEVFVAGLLDVEQEGKRFLFRTAASFVKIAAGLADKPLLTSDELTQNHHAGGGLIVFGSHVPKSTAQLVALRTMEGVDAVELSVHQVLDRVSRQVTVEATVEQVNKILAARRDALVYTSRELVSGGSHIENLSIGKSVSAALIQIIQRIDQKPRFVIGKGGITSSDLATVGMGVRAARVIGQILPGIPVWKLGSGSRWPGLIYVVFPGNVGDEMSMLHVLKKLRG